MNQIERTDETRLSNHTWELYTSLKGIQIYSGPALPMYILFWILATEMFFTFILNQFNISLLDKTPEWF